jgi:hypothetical protein
LIEKNVLEAGAVTFSVEKTSQRRAEVLKNNAIFGNRKGASQLRDTGANLTVARVPMDETTKG